LEGNQCKTYLKCNAINGIRKLGEISPYCEEPEYYKAYEWKVFDVNDPSTEIEDLLIGDTDHECIEIDLGHPYFDHFDASEQPQFIVQVSVVDYDNNMESYGMLVTLDAPLRIMLESNLTRTICPGISEVPLSLENIASGGNPPYTLIWSGLDCSKLDVGCGPSTELKPYLLTNGLSAGSVLNDLKLTVEDNDGCSVERYFEVTIAELNFEFTNDIQYSCNSNSMATIGPDDIGSLGGSGEYSFVWESNSPTYGTSLLSDPYVSNPFVQGFYAPPPLYGAITYYLTITDLLGGCQVWDEIQVLGTNNQVTADAGEDMTLCYREAGLLQGNPTGSQTVSLITKSVPVVFTKSVPAVRRKPSTNPILRPYAQAPILRAKKAWREKSIALRGA
jgi:hypothetical protein